MVLYKRIALTEAIPYAKMNLNEEANKKIYKTSRESNYILI